MTRALAAILALALLCGEAEAQTAWSSPHGEFSLAIPDGWEVVELPPNQAGVLTVAVPNREAHCYVELRGRFLGALTQDRANEEMTTLQHLDLSDPRFEFELLDGIRVATFDAEQPKTFGQWAGPIPASRSIRREFTVVHDGHIALYIINCRAVAPASEQHLADMRAFTSSLSFLPEPQ